MPINALTRSIVDARTYGRILYLVLALPLGVVEFSFLVTAISFGFGTAITLIGIPVLVAWCTPGAGSPSSSAG